MYYFEETVEAQIDRTVFELCRNLEYYLQRHPQARIRKIQVDTESLESSCGQARKKALEYLQTVPELLEHRLVKSPTVSP